MVDGSRVRTLLRGGPHDGLTKFRTARDRLGQLPDLRVAGVVYRWTGEVEDGQHVYAVVVDAAEAAEPTDEWDEVG